MQSLPQDTNWDGTLAFASDPYRFISKKCREFGTDAFLTKIMLRPTICMLGKDAAELVCDPDKFVRKSSIPKRMQRILFGFGGVQGLDGEAHRHRKAMLMSLMSPERVEQLGEFVDHWWQMAVHQWATSDQVVLYDAVSEVFCRAVCEWAGVPFPEADVKQRTADLVALFDNAGTIGPRYWMARLARRRSDEWLKQVIFDIREGRHRAPEFSAASVIANHVELDGSLLDPKVATVELNNVLRPTVAVSVFITFAGLALTKYPNGRQLFSSLDSPDLLNFIQEVRRYFPVFPVVGAVVKRDFEWQGFHFPAGTRAMLDLYGTNRDPRIWEAPDEFYPERFRDRPESAFDFIPQGGGDPHKHHRCPGEAIALELMRRSIFWLTQRMRYDVPEQDLVLEMTRLPALPRSKFVISRVEELEPAVHG